MEKPLKRKGEGKCKALENNSLVEKLIHVLWNLPALLRTLYPFTITLSWQQKHENDYISSLISKIEKGAQDLVVNRRRRVVYHVNKLNEIKIYMSLLEFYKNACVSRGGYYAAHKTMQSKGREEIVKHKNILTMYLDKSIKEADKLSQIDLPFYCMRWFYAWTNYRRLVEPLDIAEFYRLGKKNYLAARSEHYKLMERLLGEENRAEEYQYQSCAYHRNKPCSLTKDSCFWAHVEEAIISCKLLKDGETRPEDKESSRENLVKFEKYVMDLITNYAVSTEIFLKQSRFMEWWAEYETTLIDQGTSSSVLFDFMRNRKYQQYVNAADVQQIPTCSLFN